MQCNWLSVVRGDDGARACVFCGQHRREHSKCVGVASVLAMLNSQCPALQGEGFARTLRNICHGALDSHARHATDNREAHFMACLCCHHWVARRKKKTLVFPLQALAWYVNTLQPFAGKNMDHRVVVRLCQVLHERGPLPVAVEFPAPQTLALGATAPAPAAAHTTAAKTGAHSTHNTHSTLDTHSTLNTFAALFNDSEKALFARIAGDSVGAVGAHLARFYHRENACTMFSPSCALVEKLRRSRADVSDAGDALDAGDADDAP
jgi:hypothetical protein